MKTESFSDKDFAKLIQRTLLAGVFLSLSLLLLGFGFSLSGSRLGAGLLRAGVLALLLTPAARVGMLVYGYWRSGEKYFALASLAVLGLLAVSLTV